MVRHGPLGRFMADNCRLYESMGHFRFCFNFFAKVIYLERTNEWNFYPTNTKGMTIKTKTIGPSEYDAHSNIYSDFYFYRFLFAKRKRRQCCSSLFKKERAFEMEYLFSAWTWIVNERSAGLVTCRVPKVFPRWGNQWRIHRDASAANKKRERKRNQRTNSEVKELFPFFFSTKDSQRKEALGMWR